MLTHAARRPRRGLARLILCLAAAGALVACGDGQPLARVLADRPSPPSTARAGLAIDSGTAESSATLAADVPPAAALPPAGVTRSEPSLTITPRGVGGIVVGAVMPGRAVPDGPAMDRSGGGRCVRVVPAGAPPGVSVLVVDGEVVRVDADEPGIATPEGIAVGSAASRVVGAYRGRFTRQRQFGSETMIITPSVAADRALRLVVQTDGRTVTHLRGGRLPEVLWPGACEAIGVR